MAGYDASAECKALNVRCIQALCLKKLSPCNARFRFGSPLSRRQASHSSQQLTCTIMSKSCQGLLQEFVRCLLDSDCVKASVP